MKEERDDDFFIPKDRDKRADRLHQAKRIKNKAKRYLKGIFDEDQIDDKVIGKTANTFQRCSCAGCGNPRKHCKCKKTIQERRAEDINDVLE